METLLQTTLQIRRSAAVISHTHTEMRTLGDYRLLRRIASGGMSTVYLGFDEKQDRGLFAIKILAPELAEHTISVERFRVEAQIGQRINHPNLVHCHEFVADPAAPVNYLVMDYVPGTTAMQLLDDQGPLPVGLVARIMLDIAQGLAELHEQGYVHLDVKPANILIEDTGTAILADLGVARSLKTPQHPKVQDAGVGTPYYMSFEQMRNEPDLDQRTDLYSLGVTMYQLLTKRVPFPGTSFEEVYRNKEIGDYTSACTLVPEIPTIVDTIIGRLLERDKNSRLASAKKLISMLKSSGLLEKTTYFTSAEVPADDQEPTKKDVQARHDEPEPARHTTPLWKVQYRSAQGKLMQIRARISTIERFVEEGRIPPKFQVLHEGKFRAFQVVPAFQHLAGRAEELLATISPVAAGHIQHRPRMRVRFWQYAIVGVASILVTAIASTFYHLWWPEL